MLGCNIIERKLDVRSSFTHPYQAKANRIVFQRPFKRIHILNMSVFDIDLVSDKRFAEYGGRLLIIRATLFSIYINLHNEKTSGGVWMQFTVV